MKWSPNKTLFNYNDRQLSPTGILNAALIPVGPVYYTMIVEVTELLNISLRTLASSLNNQIKDLYVSAMDTMYEYSNFPRYKDIFVSAMNNPAHLGVTVNERGIYQAKFIDTDVLGDLGDLIDIQKAVYPGGGSLFGWIGLYNDWLQGKNTKYADTVNARLDMMSSFKSAPFWELIEVGNFMFDAYPRNRPANILAGFKAIYRKEMNALWVRTVALVGALYKRQLNTRFIGMEDAAVIDNNKMFAGKSWKSLKGNTIFVSGDSVRITAGKVVGCGFVLDKFGTVIRRWGGWLPR